MAEEECPKCKKGLPPWLATFADLMSLLMCFFVLLLSFATIDAVKFRKMAESVKDAFGVQREVPAAEIVMGVSVIKQEWSPSVDQDAIINEVRQETSETQQDFLDTQEKDKENEKDSRLEKEELLEQLQQKLEQEAAEQVAELHAALDEEIEKGQVTVEREGSKVIIRIQEKGSFKSGSASLDPGFFEVMDKITSVLQDRSGKIVVAGHTDNVPIHTGRFRSNWELSSARAVTVLHSMLRNPGMSEDRMLVEGHAETQPLVPNDSAENRAKNRRVELVVVQGSEEDMQVIETLSGDLIKVEN
ncbi:MAG: type VI secretion system protein TssL, long form [Chromatiales bacterium]|jgi:chemotaxis protein MotB